MEMLPLIITFIADLLKQISQAIYLYPTPQTHTHANEKTGLDPNDDAKHEWRIRSAEAFFRALCLDFFIHI